MWMVISIVLMGLCLCLLFYLIRLKKEVRSIREELILTRDKAYHRQLSISLFDKDLTAMAVELNKNLDYQKHLKLETEAAEKQIRRSVSDIAHDLRTPLTVIKGNLQMLQAEERLSPKGVSYLEICNQKTEEMRNMADDFFQLSLLESDLEEITLQRVDATNVLLQFVADQEAVIRGQKLTPKIVFPQKSIFILADEQLLTRILGNLLNNIFRHTCSDSFQICLKETAENECVITFSNEADSTELPDTRVLFERTYRGSRSRSGGGAGLGLYIVKLLAEKQKGTAGAVLEENILSVSVSFPLAK